MYLRHCKYLGLRKYLQRCKHLQCCKYLQRCKNLQRCKGNLPRKKSFTCGHCPNKQPLHISTNCLFSSIVKKKILCQKIANTCFLKALRESAVVPPPSPPPPKKLLSNMLNGISVRNLSVSMPIWMPIWMKF